MQINLENLLDKMSKNIKGESNSITVEHHTVEGYVFKYSVPDKDVVPIENSKDDMFKEMLYSLDINNKWW